MKIEIRSIKTTETTQITRPFAIYCIIILIFQSLRKEKNWKHLNPQ